MKSLDKLHFVIAILFFAYYCQTSYGLFKNYPYGMDEYNYDYSAQMFSLGKTHLNVEPVARYLVEQYMIFNGGKLYTKYAPGFPLILSLGHITGLAGAVNPLIAAFGLLVFFWILLKMFNRTYALAGMFLLGISPMYFGYAGSYYAQPLSLVINVLAFLIFVHFLKSRQMLWLVVMGFVIGYGVICRPLDGAICAMALFIGMWVHRPSRKIPFFLCWLVSFISMVLLFMFYNYSLSGKFALSVYSVFKSHEFALIPHQSSGIVASIVETTKTYWHNANSYLPYQLRYFYFGPFYLIFGGLGLIFSTIKWRYRLIAGLFIGLNIALYNFHSGTGWPQYGDRYHFTALPFAVLLVFGFIDFIWNNYSKRTWALSPVVRYLPAVLFFILCTYFSVSKGMDLRSDWKKRFDIVARINSSIEVTCPAQSIVVMNLTPEKYEFTNWSDFKRNPFLNGQRLFVRSSSSANAVQKYFPNHQICHYTFPTS